MLVVVDFWAIFYLPVKRISSSPIFTFLLFSNVFIHKIPPPPFRQWSIDFTRLVTHLSPFHRPSTLTSSTYFTCEFIQENKRERTKFSQEWKEGSRKHAFLYSVLFPWAFQEFLFMIMLDVCSNKRKVCCQRIRVILSLIILCDLHSALSSLLPSCVLLQQTHFSTSATYRSLSWDSQSPAARNNSSTFLFFFRFISSFFQLVIFCSPSICKGNGVMQLLGLYVCLSSAVAVCTDSVWIAEIPDVKN